MLSVSSNTLPFCLFFFFISLDFLFHHLFLSSLKIIFFPFQLDILISRHREGACMLLLIIFDLQTNLWRRCSVEMMSFYKWISSKDCQWSWGVRWNDSNAPRNLGPSEMAFDQILLSFCVCCVFIPIKPISPLPTYLSTYSIIQQDLACFVVNLTFSTSVSALFVFLPP